MGMDTVIEHHGQWVVDRGGMRAPRESYEIHARQLWDDFITYLPEKSWVIASDFCPALRSARRIHAALCPYTVKETNR